MSPNEGYPLGEQLKALVFARTGLRGEALVCPREQSAMTPCVARDGGICVVMTWHGPICVGCEARIEPLIEAEFEQTPARGEF